MKIDPVQLVEQGCGLMSSEKLPELLKGQRVLRV